MYWVKTREDIGSSWDKNGFPVHAKCVTWVGPFESYSDAWNNIEYGDYVFPEIHEFSDT